MRIAALTPGVNVASSRFRVRQYIPKLEKNGISVKEFPSVINYSAKLPGLLGKVRQRYIFPVSFSWVAIKTLSRSIDILRSNYYEYVWVNRIVVNPVYSERFIRKPMIYDIDDAIWINREKLIGKIAAQAEVVIAGNSYIAENLNPYNKNIRIVPTAIDTNRFRPLHKEKDGRTFTLVWSGSHDTIHYLEKIENSLARFTSYNKDSRVVIISDVMPKLRSLNPEQLEFIPWSPENEVIGIQNADVGLMPLEDTAWERGKCSYKMLQYMACGLPVIVSPVGMNKEILSRGSIGFSAVSDQHWFEKFYILSENARSAKEMGEKGRSIVEKDFSLSGISDLLSDIFINL